MVFYYLWGGGGGCWGGGGHSKNFDCFLWGGWPFSDKGASPNTSTKERELKMNVTVNNNGKHRLLIINVVNFGPIFSKNIALQFPQQSGGSQLHFM